MKSPPIQDSDDESNSDVSESESMDTAAVRRHSQTHEGEEPEKKKAKTVQVKNVAKGAATGSSSSKQVSSAITPYGDKHVSCGMCGKKAKDQHCAKAKLLRTPTDI